MEKDKIEATVDSILQKILLVVGIGLIAFLSYSLGIKNSTPTIKYEETERAITKIEELETIINEKYLWEIDKEELSESMINGYVSGLNDVYSEYISAEDMEKYMETTVMGTFYGIGIYMTETTENKILILTPMKGSPAEEAGILPGDYILKVDGESYNAEGIDAAMDSIKGEEGTSVTLTIDRNGEELEISIIRAKITMNPVGSQMLDDHIGYIDFRSFDEDTASYVLEEVLKLQEEGMEALILDIRNNGGGLVTEALDIADIFVDKDKVLLYEVDKDGNEQIDKSNASKLVDVPIVILSNGNSASASEILIGILKDYEIATIVGTTTYGKGVIQQILSLSDGSGLKLTIKEYLTPNKNKIQEIGIEPDHIVELPEELENQLTIDLEDDTQLKKAIEILKGE